ncbi:MAG: Calx-beta domain-containing protein, partial [Planctomycetota bacterium]
MRSKYRPKPPTRLRRTPVVEQLESRFLLSCNDVLGCVRFEFVEPGTSQTLTRLEVGNEAVLQVFVQDLRDAPAGFGQGYLDVAFNSNLAAVSGEIDHGSLYTFGRSGDTSTPGLIDAAGGSVSNVPNPPGDEHLLFSVPVLPASTGTFELMPSLDQDPNNQFQFFDVIGPVTDIGFCDTSIPIVNGDLGQVIVDPTSGLTTSESGDTDTFTVVLGRAPMSSVTINLSSSDTSEGTVEGSGVLTFNASNWSTPQEVTIRGVDDQRVDGNVDYTIITSAASSSDPAYSGLEVANISVTNLDDADQAGFLVDPLSGLTVQESGSSQIASLQLTSQPESNVTVEISLSDTSEASLDRSNFTFTPGNWNVPQQLTVTGRDDAVDDGDVMFEVRFNAVTTDPNYTGLTPPAISAVNLDDDTAGITLNVTDAITDESGDTAEFSLVLDSEPTSSVSIPLTSTDSSEGTLSTSQVTFTTANWNVPQTVVVTGQPDNLVDGDVSYMIVTGEATSADPLYRINPSDVSLTNLDVAPDTLITVSPLSGLTTDEAGRQASFTVVLEAEPTAEVTLPIASSDPSEGTLSVSQLVFNSGNWSQPQTVFVTGQDDDVADGDVNYSIQIGPTSSDDDAFDNLNPPDVSVTNRDLDVPGLVLANTDNLQTSESGVTDSFTVRLNTQPSSTVTLPITISDPTEGRADPSSLVFTPTNWNQPQTIDLFGMDDEIDDGDVGYSVMVGPATSGDGDYDGAVESVPVVNLDDSDTAGFALTPLGPQVTNEGGLQAQFSLTLTSEPLSEVELPILSNDASEGTVDLSNVSFLPSNWDVPQVITVTGVNDDVDDDDVSFGIRVGAPVSDDAAFADLPSQTLNFVNVDDDQAGLIVTPTAGLITGEDPTGPMPTDEVTVRLASEPVATVTVNISSSDDSEGAVSPTVLSFDASNWDQFQTVTVSGVDDTQPDGDIGYDVILATTSSDPKYAALSTSVDAVNVDDDVPGIVVDPTAVITSEDGTSVDVSFRLRTPPSADVSFSLMSNDETEGIASATSLTFTPTNWNIPQLVTITPQNDDVADGPMVFAIVTSAASSADLEYDQLEVPDVAVQNNDDDVAGVLATRIAGDRTGEDGTTVTYEVVLTSEPLAEVIVNTTSDDPGEGSVSTNALTFDAEDWNVPQTIVVTGEDDSFVDGDRPFAIQLRPSSQDPTYNDLAAESLSIFNVDDDSASLVLQVMQPTVTEGTGSPANGFDATVTLIGAVEGGFQLSVQTEDGTANAADMDFVTPTAPLPFEGTAEETQSFTISIGPDDKVEFDETFNLSLGDLIGLDPSAAANITVDRTPVVLTILNDDEATLAVNAVSLNEGTGDTPTSFVFEVTLSNPVQGGFQVDYETADDTATTADNDYAA